MKVENSFDSNYRKVLVAARRARQLQSGSNTLVNTLSSKPCKQAQDEIAAGLISYVKTDVPVIKPPVQDTGIAVIAV